MKKEIMFAVKYEGQYIFVPAPDDWSTRSSQSKQEYIRNLKLNVAKGGLGIGCTNIQEYRRLYDLIEL